jgi:nucleoside 2-deoxyribosyltransferase
MATPRKPYQAYIAGPLFTSLQRKMIEEIASIVASKRVIPYIPHIHSNEVAQTGSKWKENIFQLDVRGLDTSDFLIMWADYGFEPDPGTVWEQSRAYALKKPVIALREDHRNWSRHTGDFEEKSVMNLMMEESVDIMARNLSELEKAIEEVVQHLDKKKEE